MAMTVNHYIEAHEIAQEMIENCDFGLEVVEYFTDELVGMDHVDVFLSYADEFNFERDNVANIVTRLRSLADGIEARREVYRTVRDSNPL